jgi:CheY-like chemotaxis protein
VGSFFLHRVRASIPLASFILASRIKQYFLNQSKNLNFTQLLSCIPNTVKSIVGNAIRFQNTGLVYLWPAQDSNVHPIDFRAASQTNLKLKVANMTDTVLLVDDSKTARMQLRGPLESAGVLVLEAGSGSEGLSLVSEKKEKIGLIISDQNMPNKTGSEMVREIRQLSGNINADCPVIFLTSDSSAELRDEFAALKAKAVVLKPVNPTALIAVVKKILAKPA